MGSAFRTVLRDRATVRTMITDGEMLDKVIGVIETDGQEMTDGECLEAIYVLLREYYGE